MIQKRGQTNKDIQVISKAGILILCITAIQAQNAKDIKSKADGASYTIQLVNNFLPAESMLDFTVDKFTNTLQSYQGRLRLSLNITFKNQTVSNLVLTAPQNELNLFGATNTSIDVSDGLIDPSDQIKPPTYIRLFKLDTTTSMLDYMMYKRGNLPADKLPGLVTQLCTNESRNFNLTSEVDISEFRSEGSQYILDSSTLCMKNVDPTLNIQDLMIDFNLSLDLIDEDTQYIEIVLSKKKTKS